jgi:hypothetical protein
MDNFASLMVDETRAKLEKHEAICELRYESINSRLKRIETILIASCGFIIACLLSIALRLG